jgi:hypothetical protein
MSGVINGLAARGKLLVVGIAPDPLEVNTGSLVFGMRPSLGGPPVAYRTNKKQWSSPHSKTLSP